MAANLCNVLEDKNADWRVSELRRLGEAEREMERQLAQTRREIARLVVEMLPPHAAQAKIDDVVTASGFSRFLIDRLGGGSGTWDRL
jgi:hypothetical protein